jgi:glycine dehydrogenase subunit 1
MHNYLPHTDETRIEMLNSIGLSVIDELFSCIDAGVRLRETLNLPKGISELEAYKKINYLAQKNKTSSNSAFFLGGGTYNRFIPACVGHIAQRSEFLTAYTPYQPEISQGSLQVMYEYQSMICNLTGMDAANASVYDGATACAEAVFMAVRITKRNRVLICSTINPDYAKVIETYCNGADIEIDYLPQKNGKVDVTKLNSLEQEYDYACILVQNPNYTGSMEDVFELSEACQKLNALFIACVDPISLAVLKNPAEYNADIVVGDVQPLGISMSFGGPHAGFISCKTKYVRQLPGRIAGMTLDKDGNRAFTLTLQAREQHIRREKATSNICSNQALMAVCACVYLSVMGFEGLKEAVSTSIQRTRYLSEKVNKIDGFSVVYDNFLYEFVIKVDPKLPVKNLLQELESKNLFAGISLEEKLPHLKNCILTAVTEMNNINDLYIFINALKEMSIKYELEGNAK